MSITVVACAGCGADIVKRSVAHRLKWCAECRLKNRRHRAARQRTVSSAVVACAGCGTSIVRGPNAYRLKWCSDACRKRTLYSTPCIDCGAMTNGSDGRRRPQRCRSCSSRYQAERRRQEAEPQRRAAVELRMRGLLNTEIARELGISTNAVCNIFRRLDDAPANPYWTRPRERRRAVIELRERGLFNTQIAQRLGVSKTVVAEALRHVEDVPPSPYRMRRAA